MDIKSKSADDVKKHNKFMSFWLGRKTRAVVFAVVCLLASAAYLLGTQLTALGDKYSLGDSISYLDNSTDGYVQSRQFRHDKLSFYEALCITSSFYLRNTDDKGNFTLSNSAFLEYVQKMKNDYGLVIKKNKDGKICAESDKWDFYVAFGNKYLTNIDYNFENEDLNLLDMQEKIKERYKYYSIRTDNAVETDIQQGDSYFLDAYNSFLEREDGEIFWEEYNGSSLPLGMSGYDNLGRFVFQYFGDESIVFYDPELKDKKFSGISDYEIKNEQFYINYNNNAEDQVVTYDETTISGYELNYYSDTGISVFFAPKQSVLDNVSGEFLQTQNKYKVVFPSFVGCIILQAGLCLYLAVVCGYDSHYKNKWRKAVAFGRWYTDILLVLLVVALVGFVGYVSVSDTIINWYTHSEIYVKAVNAIIIGLLFAICGGLSLSIISKFKTKSFIKDSLIYRILRAFKDFIKKHIINTKLFKVYNQKTIGQKLYTITWIFIAATILMLVILFFNIFESEAYLVISLVLLAVYAIYAVWYAVNLFKGFADIHKLSRQIEQISKNQPVSDDVDEYSLVHVDSERLQNISENIKETVERQIQSERMKIELVTNVSHDLKTPLTSIISYIDLLKNEELPDEAMDYVKILDNKSQKLKTIVSDVFSLAKATSGIDVESEDIDGVILLRQVLGDNEDKIIKSGKSIVTEISCDSALIVADGNKLYRVFQNLIDNALNYSLDGTRIFISLKCREGKMILLAKNTASYEMNFSPDEITERFTRGDRSRTDGGNGLGLSIAKTFTEACGGKFRIELDGDVFKAFVEMPLKKANK